SLRVSRREPPVGDTLTRPVGAEHTTKVPPPGQEDSAVPRHTRFDDDPPDDWEDDFGAAEEDYDPEADWSPDDEFLPGEAAEIPCPHCGATITEDHQRCPKCGTFISREDDPEAGGTGRTWVIVVAVLLLVTIIWTLFW